MIIGISGIIGSGKDTVGLIIQYLSEVDRGAIDEYTFSFEDWYKIHSHEHLSRWEIKKFASKLKKIVSILLGCTVDDLEENAFKNKLLGEEWRRYYWSNYKLKSNLNVQGRVSKYFSSKEEAMDYKIALQSSEDTQTQAAFCQSLENEILTPRKILQIIGTEGGRDLVHPNLWVNALFAEYVPKFNGNIAKGTSLLDPDNWAYPKWIITDVRFVNEAEVIKSREGFLLRLERPGQRERNARLVDVNHPSETSLDNYKRFDWVIVNNGTIKDLVQQVKGIYEYITTIKN